MMAARWGPRRANFDAIEKARDQSPAAIAACTFESLVCNPASCGRRLYTERARTSRRGETLAGWSRMGRLGFLPVFQPHIRPGKAQGAFAAVGLWVLGPLKIEIPPAWRLTLLIHY
jgi:hypothetical protein